jgi:hypothetical protein
MQFAQDQTGQAVRFYTHPTPIFPVCGRWAALANMLTSTYSFVAIAAEQENARSVLYRVQEYIQNAWQGLHGTEALETAFNKLVQFEKNFRKRKVEMYLIPAIRRATHEADALLEELDGLSASCTKLLRAVRLRLASGIGSNAVQASELWHSLMLCCEHLLARLRREELELLPLARRVFSMEEWFAIAAQFLADDAGSKLQSGSRDRVRSRADPAPRSIAH